MRTPDPSARHDAPAPHGEPLPTLPPGFPTDPAPWWWDLYGPTGCGDPIAPEVAR